MKKLLIAILCLFSIISLVACTNSNTTKNKNTEKQTVEVYESELEAQICNVASYLNNATFAVLNYASEESESASSLGSGVIYKKIINDNNSYTCLFVTK